tara:strand:+ start:93 stop:860 length:768 start_codon:yes stop_codon:yes gene_type:complete
MPKNGQEVTVEDIAKGMQCTQCAGGGVNALDPKIMPIASPVQGRIVCSGHGRCFGNPATWSGNNAAANVIQPAEADFGKTTLCHCDAGYTGALCGIVDDPNRCKDAGDTKAQLVDGLCACSNYREFGGPWCERLAVPGSLLGGINFIHTQLDKDGNVQRIPPQVVSVNGNIITCNGRGKVRSQTRLQASSTSSLCTHGKDTTENNDLFCQPAAPGDKPQAPCKCDDDKFDEELNCLDLTEAERQKIANNANAIFA